METILSIVDDPAETRALATLLAGRFRLVHCAEGNAAADSVRRLAPAAIVLDLRIAGLDGFEVLSRLRRAAADIPVIALAADADPPTVVRAVRCGASEFLARPFGLDALLSLIDAVARKAENRGGATAGLVGSSPAIRKAAEQIRLFAASDYPVLILGESGTGKEIAARALHKLSMRQRGAFVDRSCAALPESLAESELFGTERGAFTDAVARPGAFEQAKGGVLFLDEIGEAGPGLQAKLLRALETGKVWRLGGREPVAVDIRLVSATCKDLRGAAVAGAFRTDLLYRIDTLVVELPPLRERREDIPDLAAHFALCASAGRTVLGSAALSKLAGFDWPGNIRQLRNVVHRALVLAGDAEEIAEEHIVP
jgi:two-component system response regulator AtoC